MSEEFNSMEDLAFSRSFRNWVLNKDAAENGFWENWIARNPDKAEMVKYAKAVICALHTSPTALSPDEVDEEVRKAVARLKDAPRYIPLEEMERREGRRNSRFLSWWVPGLMAAAIGAAGFFYYRAHAHSDVLQAFLNSHRHESVREQATGAAGGRKFTLPDGSLVRLGKRSKLFYSQEWASGSIRREVFLEGEAGFDIRKNPAAPFYVYTDQVITKVLGTSFDVASFPGDAQTWVVDMAGKVSVYRQEDFFGQSKGMNEPGILLTPNQMAVYDRRNNMLRKTVVKIPEPISGPDTLIIYQRASIRQVFGQLQEEYGIPIQFDEGMPDSCLLTVVVGAQPFYDKLDLICKAIGGSYEVIDGNIVVTAAGCK